MRVCAAGTATFVHEFADCLTSLDAANEPILNTKMQRMLGQYILPSTTKKGGRLIMYRLAEMPLEMLEGIDPKKHAEVMYKQSIRMMIGLFTQLISDPHVAVCGVSFCEDWADPPPMKLMMRMDNALSTSQKKVVFGLFQDVLPLRFSAFYVLNQPSWFTVILAIVKPFLSKKLRKRIYLLKNDYARFHALVDKSELPVTFGGTKDWAPVLTAEEELTKDPMKTRCTFEDLGIQSETVKEDDPPPYAMEDAPCTLQ